MPGTYTFMDGMTSAVAFVGVYWTDWLGIFMREGVIGTTHMQAVEVKRKIWVASTTYQIRERNSEEKNPAQLKENMAFDILIHLYVLC